MILDKDLIQQVISTIETQLNIFPSHNSQYPIEINSENGNELESILNFICSYFKNLLKELND